MADIVTTKRAHATVARGRTLCAPDATKKQVTGYSDDGKPIYRPVMVYFGPGQEVELSADEITELRASGYLIDPKQTPVPLAEGAHVFEHGSVAPAA